MRIISQGGHADLPYERTHLCSNTENVMARCDGKEMYLIIQNYWRKWNEKMAGGTTER